MRVACLYFSSEIDLANFAQSCLRFSPQIAIRQPNVIFIEIGRCKNLYSEESFLARLQVLLKRFKLNAKFSISSDIPSALIKAEYSTESAAELPLEALLTYGDPFLADPKGRKAIEKMIDALKRLGLKSVEQFKEIPSKQLPSRFGSIGIYCKQVLEKSIALPWPRWEPPLRFLETLVLQEWDYCADLEPLLFMLKQILDRLFSRLRGQGFKAEKMEITLELEKYSTVKLPIRKWEFDFISPQSSTSGFLPILRERLSSDLARTPIESPVLSMSCEATSITKSFAGQKNFFHEREEQEEKMGSLFGQLQESLGKENVFWAKTTEERFPEKSWRRSQKNVDASADIAGKYPKRPTRIFSKPIPLTVIQDRLSIKGKIYRTINWSSVERLSLDWLEGETARNYYRVELESGSSIWIFSDPSHHFFLHGYFE